MRQREADMISTLKENGKKIDSMATQNKRLTEQLQWQIKYTKQVEAKLKAKENEVHIADSVYIDADDRAKDSLFRAIIR